jgi:hypothetical protein
MSFPFTINGHTYTQSLWEGYNYLTTMPLLAQDISEVSIQAVDARDGAQDAQAASESAAAVTATNVIETTNNVLATESARDLALFYKNAAEAAAVSTQFAAYNSAGTSTAYEITDGSLVIDDTAAIRVTFHITNGANPTLEETVDGVPHEMVAPGNRSLSAGELAAGSAYILLYSTAISKWVVQNLALYKLTQTLDANGQIIDNAVLTNCAIRTKDGFEWAGNIVANTEVEVGYINYDCTLAGGSGDVDFGTGDISFYLSTGKTSAGGTAITGGNFNALTSGAVDTNSFTANNVVIGSSPKRVIAKCTSSASLRNAKFVFDIIKKTDD